MTSLATLDLGPLTTVEHTEGASLAERFAAFHEANPHVADVFERIAADWLAAGHERVGLKFVAEIARWQSGLQMPGEAWAINNSFVSFYARVMLARHPEWSDAIEVRAQKAVA